MTTGTLHYAASQSHTAALRARAEHTQRLVATTDKPAEARRERRSLPQMLRRLRTV